VVPNSCGLAAVTAGLFNQPDLDDLAVGIAEGHITALAFRQVVVGGIPQIICFGLGRPHAVVAKAGYFRLYGFALPA